MVKGLKTRIYQIEEQFLSPFAKKTIETKGRLIAETPCPMRTEFQRDRDRILHSKAFRRLKNKTQVFFSPEGDHYRTRLTHTLDVSQIARSIARCLALNEDLTEAIALGHDLGHTPFGHAGERVLASLNPNGFKHNEQSLRVVDLLENNGEGLNLTYEVRDGILNHKKDGKPETLEGKAVSMADRIAYVNHDIDDAIRAGLLKIEDLPQEAIAILGKTSRERINASIQAIIDISMDKNIVQMETTALNALESLRSYMFSNIYITAQTKSQEETVERMLSALYNYYYKNPSTLPELYQKLLESNSIEQVVCDYVSSMSDRYAYNQFEKIFIPRTFTLD